MNKALWGTHYDRFCQNTKNQFASPVIVVTILWHLQMLFFCVRRNIYSFNNIFISDIPELFSLQNPFGTST